VPVSQTAARSIIPAGAAALAVATGLAIGLALPVLAGAATVTSGEIRAFATSDDPAIAGHATMIRAADGKTIVTVHAVGLAPDTAYGAHVHQQACADNAAGGHYKFDPAGPPAPPNELWPAFTTNAAGVGTGRAVVDRTAGPSAVAVVIHAPGGAKIACADLS
jgi:hypothetical protein